MTTTRRKRAVEEEIMMLASVADPLPPSHSCRLAAALAKEEIIRGDDREDGERGDRRATRLPGSHFFRPRRRLNRRRSASTPQPPTIRVDASTSHDPRRRLNRRRSASTPQPPTICVDAVQGVAMTTRRKRKVGEEKMMAVASVTDPLPPLMATAARSLSSNSCRLAAAPAKERLIVMKKKLEQQGKKVATLSKKRKLQQEMMTASGVLDLLAAAACAEKETIKQQEEEEDGAGVSNVDDDRISDLPDAILGSILSRLTIKDLVRTSILSRRWLHVWTFTPLDIGEYFFCGFIRDISYHEITHCHYCLLLQTLDTIVSCHRGPIRSFTVTWSTGSLICGNHYYPFVPNTILEAWAPVLAQRGIQNVSMIYKLPPCLLTCPSVRTLELVDIEDLDQQVPLLPPNLRELKLHRRISCKIIPLLSPGILACGSLCSLEFINYYLEEPFQTQMPPNLRELRLHGGSVSAYLLERILSNCQLLDTLDLYKCCGPEKLRINSLSLTKLRLHLINERRWPLDLLVEVAPNLELLMFDKFFTEASTLRIIRAPNLRLLGCVNAYAKMLQVENTCFQDGVSMGLISQIYNLKELSVHVSLDDVRQAKLLADLLRCFPHLEYLDLEISNLSRTNPLNEDYWEFEGSSNCLDHHLQVVKFKGFTGQPNHLHFARFLIRNARILRAICFLCRHESDIKKVWTL